MNVINAKGSLTGSAGGTPELRRGRRVPDFGSTASSVARAMARSTFFARPFDLEVARSSPVPLTSTTSTTSSARFLRLASLTTSRLF